MIADTIESLVLESHMKWYDKTILVIENDFQSALLVLEFLSDTGLNVIHLTNKEWLNSDYKEPFDIIIKGISLQEMSNGLSLLKRIKQAYPNTPIIAYSASVFSHEIKACYDAGCIDFIGKPVDLDSLKNILNRYL